MAAHFGTPPAGEVWAGDDAAVLSGERSLVVLTIDTLVERIDFDLAYCSGEDIGWKSVAVNVSDVAAMGSRAVNAVVSLALPGGTTVAVVDGIARGIAAAARRWGVTVVGGDVSSASEISVTVAVRGVVGDVGPVLRSGARPGHALCVTGALGGAAAGLMSLRRHANREVAPPEARLRARQLRPEARADAGIRLAGVVAAMIDVSDGFAADLSNLLDRSRAGCAVEIEDIPVDEDLLELARDPAWAEVDPLLLALTGGEDFELLCAVDEARLDEARAAASSAGVGLTRIGTVVADDRRVGRYDLDRYRRLAWEHLQDR